MSKYNYLSVGNDAKTIKGQKQGVLTGILYLAPHNIASPKSICPFSTEGCRAVCLYSAGHGAFNSVQEARIRKTKAYHEDAGAFRLAILEDVDKLVADSVKKGFKPAVRLNGTSDILWEQQDIMQQRPDVQFYDYTKFPSILRKELPANYHLTYSFSGGDQSWKFAEAWLARGANVAVVFRGGLPDTFRDYPVINGDESDLRFTDPKGCIVGLKTKGVARSGKVDDDGFVQQGVAA